MGLLLIASELVLSTFFVLFFGISALLIGIILYSFNLSNVIQSEAILFSVWAISSGLVSLIWFKKINPHLAKIKYSEKNKTKLLGKPGLSLLAM